MSRRASKWKILVRVVLSPIWGPVWLIGYTGYYVIRALMATTFWLLSDGTWAQEWSDNA